MATNVLAIDVASSGMSLIALISSLDTFRTTTGPFSDMVVVFSEKSLWVYSSAIVKFSGCRTIPEMFSELVLTVSEKNKVSS